MYVCLCVCTFVYVCLCMCVCVCVFVCVCVLRIYNAYIKQVWRDEPQSQQQGNEELLLAYRAVEEPGGNMMCNM
jgi:hypothetical protein